ncbi:hypothetical protein CHGG_02787 [Chaetomium globosum CBS 148.51]|jgi:hypothetical protein|uniref:RING zinc finger-like domain-containing protein n=1 Tax=Chaetomium globosum (strain ATCC 6205 / CBS 148.51 / DSM 1962 / NBRC 6347 / NRRL 1970) TaxID=306901 RepID=Q2HAG7_CHAGB|nr:uncharacterized protein CHGG_02787 [Chaetomium globosum CBS 148.51]EAQ90852.1 hypothetical protein CHGG_02787 [Chaetomium globosum CBS 148.51]
MPPRSSLTSSFSITDANNEVVCPLRNQDGSSCRKRCIGEKRYRSMQEHIRRAHPEHYIAKLPATEESFLAMINTSPSERPQPQPTSGPPHHQAKGPMHGFRRDESNGPGTPRRFEDYSGGTMFPAAAALAQLHNNHKSDSGWESDREWHSDTEGARRRPRSSVELPPIQFSPADITSAPLPGFDSPRQRDLLPSMINRSPPGRSSTLPPLPRPLGPGRPRKQSISKRGHHRRKSKAPGSDWLRRMQNEGTPDLLRPGGGHDRKALSAEPGSRWEDLIYAAASATEDIDEDRTPVSPKFGSVLDPRLTNPSQMPQSPVSIQRSSLPPFTQQAFSNYRASPLQPALTPPSCNPEAPDAFPSVESGESGNTFHIDSHGLTSDSSPSYSSQNTQIYCAACQNISLLRESYACTECICGLCQACVDVLISEQGARRKCPRCATIGGRFKPFQLDIR